MFSSEFSARQRIHTKTQALFSSKDKSKRIKCRLLQILFCALRLNDGKQRQTQNQATTDIDIQF